ncbi:MAG: hypothetical protein OEW91_13600, partial [Acidimicrobiia bacterium]|nr:hypothetical protein [Acidimicrobiia bacterium]
MNIDERLRTASADLAEVHRRRPTPTLRPQPPHRRWMPAAAAAAVVLIVFVGFAARDGTPVDPANLTTVTTTQFTTTTTTPTTSTTESATTTDPVVPVDPELAWSETDAERMVEGYLAALADGQWDIAAFSMENNGVAPKGALRGETPRDFLERSCGTGLCAGPYVVVADGPGVINPETAQAESSVTVTHVASGETRGIRIATFEGQPIIADLPPLASGDGDSLVSTLFGDDPPDDLAIGRFEAIERWIGGARTWALQWLVDDFQDV